MLDRIIAAVRSYLRALYPPALRPLTSAQRNAQIRDLAARGEAQSDIASAFGLSPQRVFQIVHGRNH